jgi:hypothetical protein
MQKQKENTKFHTAEQYSKFQIVCMELEYMGGEVTEVTPRPV